MSAESILQDVFSGKISKQLGMHRVACHTMCVAQCFCKCGNILDERTVVVVTVNTTRRRVIQAFCPVCWSGSTGKRILDVAKLTATATRIENWQDGIVFEQGDVDAE